jgi:hypothetical protein
MQKTIMCYGDKPSKYEKQPEIVRWSAIRNCPDCDKKRSSACKNPDCKS